MKITDSRELELLASIESMPVLTQRLLAKRLGVALGTANNLVQNLVSRDWVELSNRGNGARYHLTTKGVAAKLHLLRLHLRETVSDYAALRDQVSSRFNTLQKRSSSVVFYGAGDMAEIAYVALRTSSGRLIGVVDDAKAGGLFFEHRVLHPSQLKPDELAGSPYDLVVLASHSSGNRMRDKLLARGFPVVRILRLFDRLEFRDSDL